MTMQYGIWAAVALGVLALLLLLRWGRGALLLSSVRRFANSSPSLAQAVQLRRRVASAFLTSSIGKALQEIDFIKFSNGYRFYQLDRPADIKEIQDWERQHWTDLPVDRIWAGGKQLRLPALCARCGRPVQRSLRKISSSSVQDPSGATSMSYSVELPMCPNDACLIDEEKQFFRPFPRLRVPGDWGGIEVKYGESAKIENHTLVNIHRSFAGAVLGT
jgi:hypothetical protein